MSSKCSLCNAELTSMDTLLGANNLADGGVLCNRCLEKVSESNEELLYALSKFNIHDIQNLIERERVEQRQPAVKMEENLPVLIDQEAESISSDVYKRRLRKIKYELERLKANLSMFTKGEIKELPHLISEEEKIIAITDAQFINTLDAGILVVTPRRIISVSKAMFAVVKIHEYPNESIQAVSFVTDPTSPIIKLHLSEKVVEFECYFDKDDAERFYDKIKMIYNNTPEQPQKQMGTVKKASSEEIFEQLEKLGKLRERGILTDTEFTEQKKKLLDQLG
ncbi:MAG: PH domain-containing protein [Chryseobacterium sp.]|uniref:PH domain-containing protein n=1 Tax=Chryseobacterium sp. TaxID=1871047 RepID=UPI0025BAE8AD|nr:PH domain-containing protein [Chryseobacterium sp.]MCJ7932162.1 PH domain-containing protein [Chryseobacterium sp.]